MSRSKVTDLVRHEVFLKMPIIVFWDATYPAGSHLKLELLSTFSERSFQNLSFGTIFRVSRTTFWKKQGKQCFQRWNRCVRFKVVRLSSSIPWDLRHAEKLLFLCPCSNLTVYRQKWQWFLAENQLYELMSHRIGWWCPKWCPKKSLQFSTINSEFWA